MGKKVKHSVCVHVCMCACMHVCGWVCVKSSHASVKSFTQPAYSFSYKDGKSVLIMETLWKNNLNFIKDMLMFYINFIIIILNSF